MHAPLQAELSQPGLRTPVEQRILHLHADQRHPGIQHHRGVPAVKIGAADVGNQAFLAQRLQGLRRLYPARNLVVPPVELHQIKPLGAQASE